jgi:hypothetical protein
LYLAQFVSAKSKVARQLDGTNPEFRRQIVAVNMNVWRLVGFVTVKVETIRPDRSTVGIPKFYQGSQRKNDISRRLCNPPGGNLAACLTILMQASSLLNLLLDLLDRPRRLCSRSSSGCSSE